MVNDDNDNGIIHDNTGLIINGLIMINSRMIIG